MENQKRKKSFYFILYLVGVIAGLGLTLLATWGDLEAAFYGFDRVGSLRLSSLSCPILMSANETSSFSIKIKNSLDRKLAPSIKTDVSSSIVPITTYESTVLQPGETKKMEWAIGPENIDLGRFIFIRVWTYASYPQPDRESTCGVVIHPFGINGNIFTWGFVALSILGGGLGLYGMKQIDESNGSGMKMSRTTLLAIVALIGLVNSFIGIWLIGVVILALALLISVVSAGFSVKL